jgi:endonuclease/exonuclease/phosphatase family metal-dependent hydrolase
MLFWIIRLKLLFLISFSVLLCGILFFDLSMPFNFKKEQAEEIESIKIMNYNVRLFGLYDWYNNKSIRNKMFDFIHSENPDILCLQEFFHSDDPDYFITLDTLTRFLKAKNYHVAYTTRLYDKHNWGIATFSKFPIVERHHLSFGEKLNNTCIYTDIKINEDTVRVYNLHLASVGLSKEDAKFMDGDIKTGDFESLNRFKRIYRQLKRAFVKRSNQVKQIAESIKFTRHPVILCGDFNDVPGSYAYNSISSLLKDSFKEKGLGTGATYHELILPLRIDFIFGSSEIEIIEHRIPKIKLSDHYPQIVRVKRL